MIAFPSLLVAPAKEAGIKVPENLDVYVPDDFMQWHVFTLWQLGRPMPWATVHWENAKLIADIPDEELLKLKTVRELLGFLTVKGLA